jgi:tRNA threonylcarbamoyladenosine biosynthesis protein TsaE
MRVVLLSSSAEDTRSISRELGRALAKGDVVALFGDLGAGKTVFCKGIGEGLGLHPDRIVSPSFTIVTEHPSAPLLFHVDAYRLASEREAAEIGLEEILSGEGICVVEWAERISSLLPNDCIRVRFTISEGDGRLLDVETTDSPRFEDFIRRCRSYISGG